ncbi:hypothetical protein niasHT_010915 [Heterodera trifolii]|uniref:CCHC-type domain-containing protein n=1 Tax=Heterodera trifolii TaxID=157864 RepID=A0ABD2LG72_9BILA
MSFDSFVALAVRAEEVQRATISAESGKRYRPNFQQKPTLAPQKIFAPRTNQIICNNCNKMGHISRKCGQIEWKYFNYAPKSPQQQNFPMKSDDFRKHSVDKKKANNFRMSNQPSAQQKNMETENKLKAPNRQRNASSS